MRTRQQVTTHRLVPEELECWLWRLTTHRSLAHNRDFRCACAGPKLLEWLSEIARETNGSTPLHLWSASHYGGHRYAGNCVAYPSGDWFGLINSKDDVQQMVAALEDDEPLRLADQWRGRIRLSKEEQIEALKQVVDGEAEA